MKARTKVLPLLLAAALAFPGAGVLAAESDDTESVTKVEEAEADENEEAEDGSEDEEIEDGAEESESLEPVPEDEVTDEMLEEGWVILSDGYAYPPEYFEGSDAGAVASTVADFNDDTTYNVTFSASVPDGITETVMIYFMDISNYREYGIELYYTAGYATTVKMPAGTYYFTGGGPVSDYYSVYSVSDPDYFTVEESAVNSVELTISMRGDTLGFAEDEDDEEEAEEESGEESGVLTYKKENRLLYLLLAAGFLGVGALAVWLVYKNANKKKKDQTQRKE